MQRSILCAVALCAFTGLGVSVAAPPHTALSASAARGRQLFMTVGCYQCHGHNAEGTVGPRLAPNILTREVLTAILRHPLNVMPVYTAKILPDADVADLYAFLNSIPQPKAVADIPLLNQ